MEFNRCSLCKEFHWDNQKCNPIYYFKHEDWGDDFQEIRASSFEDAAEKFAIKYNTNGDYNLMDNTIEVIISDGKTEKKFDVSAEPSINYHVKER
jgi:hypothetical protein